MSAGIDYLRSLAPRNLLPFERHAWLDGFLCATLFFDREVEAQVEGNRSETPEYSAYLAGRSAGANWQALGNAEAQPAPSVDEWTVFNSAGAEVATGVSRLLAHDYLTDARLKRGWSAVCVVSEANSLVESPEGAQ